MYLHNIEKSFNTLVFKSISFNFVKGKRYAIFGRNGSGKTTLLNIMNGNLSPDSGSLDFNNYEIVFIRDNSIPFPFMSAIEFVRLTCELKEIKYIKSNVLALFEEFGLLGKEDALLGSYSQGMKFKVLLIIVFLSDLDILLLDEPFSELDFLTMNKLSQMLDKYLKNVTLIFTSHSVGIAHKIADEYLILTENSLKTVSKEITTIKAETVEQQLVKEMESIY